MDARAPARTPPRAKPDALAPGRAPLSDPLSWALILALGLIWGGSFTVVGVAVRDLPPLTLAAGRLVIGALALVLLACLVGPGLPPLRERRLWLFALGVAASANAIPFSLLGWAQTTLPSGLAGVIMASMPLITLALAARFVPGEPLTWRRLIGLGIGFCGVVTLIGVETLLHLGGEGRRVLAQLACLAAATGYAAGSVLTKRAPAAHPLAFGAATLLLAAAMAASAALLVDAPFSPEALAAWTADSVLAVIFLGLAPTALAMVLLLLALERRGPGFVSLTNYFVPIWALVFGVALLGEAIPGETPLALALILGGVAYAQGYGAAALRALRRGRRSE